MSTADDDRQRELRRETVRRWYQRHRKQYLARRRKRRRYDEEFAGKLREYGYRYFDNNRDAINVERRERMADPEYKQHVDRLHAEWCEKVRNGYVPRWPELRIEINGKEQRVYRASEVARLLGCSAAVLIRWRKAGWLPEASHSHRGRAVYTRHQVDLIGYFYEQNPHDHDARSEASKYIFEKWKQ